jgi:hypothetical protein
MPVELKTAKQSAIRTRGKRVRTISDGCTVIAAKVLQDENLTLSQLDAAVVALDLAKRVLTLDVS